MVLWLRARFSRLVFAITSRRFDDELRSEIEAHLESLTERFRRQGLSADEAYVAARRQFGNTTALQQDIREMNTIGWIERTSLDLRYAVRQLRHSAGFAGIVIATLGIGIGGATAVYSVVQSVLFEPLPYEESGRLVRFYQQDPENPGTRDVLAATHFAFMREHATTFEAVAALAHYSETGLDLVAGGRAQRLRVLRVSSGYFATLRAAPRLGREFDRADEVGANRVILSDAVWRSHFGADPSIVGTTVHLSAEPYEVAGVAPPGFEDPIAPDVAAWLPYRVARDTYEENNSLTGIGRLRAGVSLTGAQAELATLGPRMRERWPAAKKSAIVATPLHDTLVDRARGPLVLVFGAVALVLLVACVNVANLALVRATGRVHEFAIRAALGSGRARLARQLFVESLVLASLGGLAGLALAYLGIGVLHGLGREALPRLDRVDIDANVLIFAIAATVATALAFGVAPAWRLAGTPPLEALRQQSRSSTSTRGLARLRGTLAAAQVGLALTLLVGAGVLVTSFYRLRQVDVGVRVDRVLTFEVNLPTARYDEKQRASFQEDLATRLDTLAGVTAAGGISRLPVTGNYHPWNVRIVSGPLAGTSIDRSRYAMQNRVVSGNPFAALGIPLLAGRHFDNRDHATAPGRVMVSENFARVAFPGLPNEHVVGQRLAARGELEIIGIVGDVSLDVYGTPTMVVYRPHRQFANDRNWALTQVVAADRSTEELLTAVRQEVSRMNPELVVHRPMTMSEVVGRGAARERFALVLMATFAVVALALAALGIYGVLAYAVRQRTTEIGIRVALGATGGHVRALVLRQAGVVIGVGVAAGLAGALALGRWLEVLAFGITPSDPRLLLVSTVVLVGVAIVAAWIPARRAALVDPSIAMHEAQ